MGKIVRLKTWSEFKELAINLHPKSILYFLQRAPLSNPPVALRLVFASEDKQYIFIDCADGKTLRQTKIPVFFTEKGEACIRDEDIKQFIAAELKRTDLLILTPVWRMEWR